MHKHITSILTFQIPQQTASLSNQFSGNLNSFRESTQNQLPTQSIYNQQFQQQGYLQPSYQNNQIYPSVQIAPQQVFQNQNNYMMEYTHQSNPYNYTQHHQLSLQPQSTGLSLGTVGMIPHVQTTSGYGLSQSYSNLPTTIPAVPQLNSLSSNQPRIPTASSFNHNIDPFSSLDQSSSSSTYIATSNSFESMAADIPLSNPLPQSKNPEYPTELSSLPTSLPPTIPEYYPPPLPPPQSPNFISYSAPPAPSLGQYQTTLQPMTPCDITNSSQYPVQSNEEIPMYAPPPPPAIPTLPPPSFD